ncbi:MULTISPECIES: septum formation initiator family protein [Devosia]|jgi:cell division protein FtsB|uniref:Septum formation initiator family protein n=1 Tax=Devosia litorisediminis TaxID=2829817 RepID=A0A942I634_9HYPH|nr:MULTISPECIES: septum formation initiator family protein [Devosia]MBS3848408.1 septum formation initiator family protein [Devosia litorisediminis]MCZ4345080.1 septum formation initiator family protein [Devosia neptuniae]|tara:strand:- start:41145 stop:41546 length:402 start_codon:yes stop_codon:yes gene_type:complete|eukprot:GHVR01146848.1.p1 GENE.GHVR01146848.1~~GHVR01146848.1.p1  ORF type:complete len:134 (+),score=12.31 GHVR01146848.1:291-692(+)
MSTTRLKRPAIWRPLALTVALLGFQGYLGFSAIGGQFGIENRAEILLDIDQLKAKSSALQAEIDDYRHRATLMDPRRLDPDIVTERARSLLNMANVDDIIVMVDPRSGKPISSKFQELATDELTAIIEADSTL